MMESKVIVCPICGKKTFLRIQDGGYLNEYPIRVNCYNCRALLKGTYIMTTQSPYRGLFMLNAEVEECDVDTVTISCKNADYVAEVSGELPCRYVREYIGGIPDSPFMRNADLLDSLEKHIKRLEYFTQNMLEWKLRKSTAFQLLDEGSMDYISKATNNKMGEYTYECDHYLKAIHCLQEIVLEETKDLFHTPKQDEYVKSVIDEMSKLDKNMLHQFAEQLGGVSALLSLYRKAIEVFSEFMNIYPNLLPAETYMNYRDKSIGDKCIATCSLSDIKTYYQDSYEALLSLMFIPVCLDNALIRGDYQIFDASYNDVFCHNNRNRDLDWYKKIDNGTRINKLNNTEPFQKLTAFPANRHLRNGIGHNNIKYDSIKQIVTAYDLKRPERINYQGSLMDIALECIGLARSVVGFSEIILYILRCESRTKGLHTIIHPRFYKDAQPNDKCPCGSGMKYKKCCQIEVEAVKRCK